MKKRDARKLIVSFPDFAAYHTRVSPDKSASYGDDDDEYVYVKAYKIVSKAKAQVEAKEKAVEDSTRNDVKTLARPNLLKQEASQNNVVKKKKSAKDAAEATDYAKMKRTESNDAKDLREESSRQET